MTSLRTDLSIGLIKRIDPESYTKLYNLYVNGAYGEPNQTLFDNLTLKDVDTRYQMTQRVFSLFQQSQFIDEFLMRVVLLFDIPEVPSEILYNINLNNVLRDTLVEFYIKNILHPRFQEWIDARQIFHLKAIEFFKEKSRIFTTQDLFFENLYGETNQRNDRKYIKIHDNYANQTKFFELYLYVMYIITPDTNAQEIWNIFQNMIQMPIQFYTKIVNKLLQEMVSKMFGPLSERDNFSIYKLNQSILFISVDFERKLIDTIVQKNQSKVNIIFGDFPNLNKLWNECKSITPNLSYIQTFYSWIETIEYAIVFLRINLFERLKDYSYSYAYENNITESLDDLRKGSMDGLIRLSDENLESIRDYLKNDIQVKRVLQDPQQFLDDLFKTQYSQMTDITKLYYFSKYTDATIKQKIIEYDIRTKLDIDELRFMRLFSGLSSDLDGDEQLITSLEEYRRIWNIIMA